MENSRGERSITKHIEFDVKFKKTPKVMVSISLLDTERGTNLRVNVYAEHINASGFDLRIAIGMTLNFIDLEVLGFLLSILIKNL